MEGHAKGRGLQTLAGVLLLSLIAQAVFSLLISAIAQSDGWSLPKGALLHSVLSSCQIDHVARDAGGAVEHMICPTRLAGEDFPRVLRDAVVASEDERYYYHGAIDYPSTLRAAWHFSFGDRQGGSTITQQLARSLLLRKDDSFRRKLLEAVLALRIQSLLTKSDVLTRYLNIAPHARNMYGFDDPARYYFGVKVQDLDLAEAALLVGMLPEPNNRDPLKNPVDALAGAKAVLRHMAEQKKVTEADAADAEQELSTRMRSGRLRRGNDLYQRLDYRPYRDLALREARASGIQLAGDYRLIVFVDPAFQRKLSDELCSITGAHQGAGVFMRPSGEVLALSGACSYTGAWNRVADMARSIGSTGKLFPLIGAHEAGISLNTRASTAPLRRNRWPAESNHRCLQRRSVSLYFALAQSCNRPWTGVSMQLGQRVLEIVRRFDIVPPQVPALVPIGGVYTSPLHLTRAYAAVKNKGLMPEPRYLIAAVGPQGSILGLPKVAAQKRVMSQAVASSVLQDLRGPVKGGTGHLANSVHALVYGKTGTSSRNMDALFVGLTDDYVGSLWLGYDRPAPMPGVTGGGAPARAFATLTDVYYVRQAQARYAEARQGGSARWRALAPSGSLARLVAAFGTIAMTCAVLGPFRRRRETPGSATLETAPASSADLGAEGECAG
jgi:penicillin-binding protein 1A